VATRSSEMTLGGIVFFYNFTRCKCFVFWELCCGYAPNLEAVADVTTSAKFLADRLRGSILWRRGWKSGFP